jgi:hypothetical protein
MERAVMELAEALVFVGMFRRYLVREAEKEELEGFSRNKVEAGSFDLAGAWLGLGGAAKGVSVLLHLFELVYN